MKKSLTARVLLNQYTELKNKSLDWLINSWEKKGTEKEFCLSMYKKYSQQAREIAVKMANLYD